MHTSNLEVSRADILDGVAAVPAAVPSTWTGLASTGCQLELEAILPGLSGLESLLDDAKAAVALIPTEDEG